MRARWLVLSFVVATTGSPRAFAQSASVQAQSLFDEGRALVQAGKLAQACAAFDSSQKLDPAITTLLNLADCREQNGQLATAWGTFVEAGRMARESNNARLARVASNHARKLEPRLSKLTIDIPADRQVPGLEILRNQERVHPAGWNHALPIDGGTYTITARAPGRAPWSVTRTIKIASDAQVVQIPKLTAAGQASPFAAVRPTQAPPAPPPPAPQRPVAPPITASAGTPAGSAPPPPAPQRPMAPPITASAGTPAGSAPPPPPPPRPVAPPITASAGTPAGSAPPPQRPTTPPAAALRTGAPADAAPIAPSAKPAAPVVADTSDGSPADSVRPPSPAPSKDQPRARRSRRLTLALGAGAVVLGGAALAFKLSGDGIYERAEASTDQVERDDLYHSANRRAYVAQGLGVAALGCAGAAVYLYVRGRAEARADTTAITPVAAPQFAGLAVAGRW